MNNPLWLAKLFGLHLIFALFQTWKKNVGFLQALKTWALSLKKNKKGSLRTALLKTVMAKTFSASIAFVITTISKFAKQRNFIMNRKLHSHEYQRAIYFSNCSEIEEKYENGLTDLHNSVICFRLSVLMKQALVIYIC